MIAEGYATEDETTTHKGVLVWKTGAAIQHPDGLESGRPRILFQLVPEPKTVKNRVHIDLDADDPAAEKARLLGLGATVVAEYAGEHIVLADPEGNEFCLMYG